jgi:hypothetical protein
LIGELLKAGAVYEQKVHYPIIYDKNNDFPLNHTAPENEQKMQMINPTFQQQQQQS